MNSPSPKLQRWHPKSQGSLDRIILEYLLPYNLDSSIALQCDGFRYRAPRWIRGSSYPTSAHKPLEKDLATPRYSPDFGTIGYHSLPGKLRPLTKDNSKKDPTCNTIYIAALPPTGSCSQDIWEETSEQIMQVKASWSDDIGQSYGHYKSGYQKEDTKSRDVSTLFRLPYSGKRPSDQKECTMLG